MYLNILILPLISSFNSIILSRWIGYLTIPILSIITICLSWIISILVFYEVSIMKSPCYIKLSEWITTDLYNIKWEFLYDQLSSSMLIVVLTISLVVHIYSYDYLSEDPHISRFFSYISLFTFFMILLVISNNLIILFFGWEGVGICSYLLINFWYSRIQANKSAIKAVFVNKFGDITFLLALILILISFKTIDFESAWFFCKDLFSKEIIFLNIVFNLNSFIAFFLIFAAMGKSAQIGLHIWLPDAMEGPTPVSSLIHAATMVTAGLFLIIRTSYIFEESFNILYFISIIGALTAILSALIGISQYDIKKIIAYSTCSQLGYMFFICAYSNFNLSMFHLINHAFFKALLFLSAGAIIHSLSNEQDLRKMGGLFKIFPFIYVSFLIGTFSLIGFPFLNGFYSKDLIIESSYFFSNNIIFYKTNLLYLIKSFYWILTISIIFTTLYSFKIIIFGFLNVYNGYKEKINKQYFELTNFIAISLFILSIITIISGYYLNNLLNLYNSFFWNNSIFYTTIWDFEFINKYNKLIPFLFGFYSIFFVYLFFTNKKIIHCLSIIKIWKPIFLIFTFFNNKFFFDKFYNIFSIYLLKTYSYSTTYLSIDKGLLEIFSSYIIIIKIKKLDLFFHKYKFSLLYNYISYIIIYIIIGFCFIFCFIDFTNTTSFLQNTNFIFFIIKNKC